jgi:hypothetical protein
MGQMAGQDHGADGGARQKVCSLPATMGQLRLRPFLRDIFAVI